MEDLVNLSLDEIIALQNKKKGARGGIRSGGRGRAFSGRIRGRRIPVVKNLNRAPFSRRTESASKLVVSNLAPRVTTADLQELFADHPYTDIAIHYDSSGRSLGTADVFFKRFSDAMFLKRQFMGVKLDGRLLDLFAVSSSSSPTRSRLRGVAQGGIRKRSGGFGSRASIGRAGGRRRRPRDENPRKKMTTEDLDRELDLYMRGSKHAKISAP
ncbi:hypothetical protein AB6A40_002369 [Gnathostoma spinigerum]|uniref:RRM domain-containing protein n=1 Tax=Gnathostoma spinigerum TaxID=75299 RepID=A0ABD6EH64_9BILA